jgi:hypothetical protein
MGVSGGAVARLRRTRFVSYWMVSRQTVLELKKSLI